MNQPRPLFAYALAAEAIALGILAYTTGSTWLLPLAATAALLAGLGVNLRALGLLSCLFMTGIWLWGWQSGKPLGQLNSTHPVGALLAGSALAFLNILSALKKRGLSSLPLCMGRLAVFLHFITAGVLLGALYLQSSWQLGIACSFALLNLVLIFDCTLRLLARLYTPARHWDRIAHPGAFFFYRWLGPEWRACLPEREQRDDSFDLKLAEMWMWPTVSKALPSLCLTVLALVWILTCLHELPVGSAGLRHQLGRWENSALRPGLHLSLPWPLGGIELVSTDQLREVVLGFRADPGQPILWEKAHYEDEQKSLVGSGDDFLSISVPVFYRVGDAALFLRSTPDAESLLRDLAQRVLLDLTLRLPARDIMTTSREQLRQRFHQNLQAALDEAQSGLSLVNVYLRDIHPPVSVAPTFQEVVSALEEKEALLHEGEAYRRDILSRAQGDAQAILIAARSSASNRLQQVIGQTSRYTDMLASWQQSKDLYQWREGFRVLDDTLAGAKKAIFDEAIRGDMPTHVDLRKVLNPDFVDTVPPTPQSLVPRPAKSREAFDLDIEGYLRADQGEVPAPDFSKQDNDNLLKPESSQAMQPDLSQP